MHVVVGATLVRMPLAGMSMIAASWAWALRRLGHTVTVVERAGWPHSCYDPTDDTFGDDPTFGLGFAATFLDAFGLGDLWCFEDVHGRWHGPAAAGVVAALRDADLLLDLEAEWRERAGPRTTTVFVDGEPGWTQAKIAAGERAYGDLLASYDACFTLGAGVPAEASLVPPVGIAWRHTFAPARLDLVSPRPVPDDAAYTTLMNWRSHRTVDVAGRALGQKDVEFARFVDLPRRARVPLEVAVSGPGVPRASLREHGWRVREGNDVSRSLGGYLSFVEGSRGSFTVAKEVFAALRVGWVSDREAYYLAAGRPVVIQDTGLAGVLPLGEGLVAVDSLDEAVDALDDIERAYPRHAARGRELAHEHFRADVVAGRLLAALG